MPTTATPSSPIAQASPREPPPCRPVSAPTTSSCCQVCPTPCFLPLQFYGLCCLGCLRKYSGSFVLYGGGSVLAALFCMPVLRMHTPWGVTYPIPDSSFLLQGVPNLLPNPPFSPVLPYVCFVTLCQDLLKALMHVLCTPTSTDCRKAHTLF